MILNVEKHLAVWVESGLLSSAQAAAIARFERDNGAGSWVIYGIVGIGVTTVATGVVSLIAANWDLIPGGVKIVAYFCLQSLVGAFFLSREKQKDVWREAALLLFALLFLSGIGLLSQVYHLAGNGWEALLLWLVITLPVALLAESRILAHIWVVTVVLTGILWTGSSGAAFPGFAPRFMLTISLPILLTGFGFFAESFVRVPEPFRHATVHWGIALAVGAGSALGNFLWLEPRPFLNSGQENLVIPWMAIAFTMTAAYFRRKIATAILLFVLGLYVTIPLVVHVELLGPTPQKIVGAVGFLAVWSLAATAAALADYRRLFDIASLVIALRFIAIYFEVFGTLWSTGIGLILSGLVILGVAWSWHRFRAAAHGFLKGKR